MHPGPLALAIEWERRAQVYTCASFTSRADFSMKIEEYEKIEFIRKIKIEDKVLKFSVPNQMADYRAQTLLSKEPETISWLNEMGPESVLYDIGANVGVYSLYAAFLRSVSVFSFEPESANGALLNRNIRLNRLHDKISALPFALSDRLSLSELALGMQMAGGSQHVLDHVVSQPGADFGKQTTVSCPLDWLVEILSLPYPTDIKIDVDGAEKLVVGGAKETLLHPSLRSVLIEIDTRIAGYDGILQSFKNAGFDYDKDQVERSMRKDGPFAGCANFIFRRQ